MARLETFGENHEVFVMSKAEYAELVALLTAAIQGVPAPGQQAGALPTFIVTGNNGERWRLSFNVE